MKNINERIARIQHLSAQIDDAINFARGTQILKNMRPTTDGWMEGVIRKTKGKTMYPPASVAAIRGKTDGILPKSWTKGMNPKEAREYALPAMQDIRNRIAADLRDARKRTR